MRRNNPFFVVAGHKLSPNEETEKGKPFFFLKSHRFVLLWSDTHQGWGKNEKSLPKTADFDQRQKKKRDPLWVLLLPREVWEMTFFHAQRMGFDENTLFSISFSQCYIHSAVCFKEVSLLKL